MTLPASPVGSSLQQPLDAFLNRTSTIVRSVRLTELLTDFAQSRPGGGNTKAKSLGKAIRRDGTTGLQVTIDGALLLLCAAFEQFVVDLMVAYVSELPARVPAYVDLPEEIRTSHELQTGEALARSRSRFANITRQQFVQNLSVCVSGITPYVINGTAIAMTDRNLTSRELTDLMRRLAIDKCWENISRTRTMRNWSGRGWRQTQSRAVNELNQLIEDRNRIAHSAGTATIGGGAVIEHLAFMRSLAKAVTKVLSEQLAAL